MVDILPSILTSELGQFRALMEQYHQAVPIIHVDCADGQFVPQHLLTIAQLSSVPTEAHLEVHLMVQQPHTWVTSALTCPQIETLIVHFETGEDVSALTVLCHSADKRLGVAINPRTSVEAIDSVLSVVDQVTVMMVEPGSYGGTYLPAMLQKVRQLHARHPDLLLEVDGGENPEHVVDAVEAGARRIVVGSFLLDHPRALEALRQLKSEANR
jgi:ribulose-phosphate 3-epimerase